MRTIEQWESVWEDMKFFTRFHNKPVWIVPKKDGYYISIIKPEREELPEGTSACLYSTNHEMIEYVDSK